MRNLTIGIILVAVIITIVTVVVLLFGMGFDFNNDTQIEETLMLNGVGDYSEWTRNHPCKEPSRYQCLDEPFDESEDERAGIYIVNFGDEPAVWLTDWYTIESPESSTVSDFTIHAKLIHFTAGEDTNDRIKLGFNLDGFQYWSDEIYPSEDWESVEETWSINPMTGFPFTKSEIENIQIGITGFCDTVYPLYCHAMYVTIN